MRTIQPFKIADANTRMTRILALLSKFQSNKVLNDWTVQIEPNPIDFQGLMLSKPSLIEPNGRTSHWTGRVQRMFTGLKCPSGTWGFMYDARDFGIATSVVKEISKAQ